MSSPAQQDPHLSAPGVAQLVHAGPDATMQPEDADAVASQDAAADAAHATLLLPRIILIRHGQSLFNAMDAAHSQLPPVGQSKRNLGSSSAAPSQEGSIIAGLTLERERGPYYDPRLLDAPLTPLGQQQARQAHHQVRDLGVDLVLSTPLTRAIQTSLLVFRPEANRIDWSRASIPSLDQPMRNVTIAAPSSQPTTPQPPIRIIPYHVEVLFASCDVGMPLSVLASRFADESNLDFVTAQRMMSDCWWAGSSVGNNVSHLVIKRAPIVRAPVASAAAASASSATPAAASTVTLKPLSSVATLSIAREQSHQIESRTKKLLLYLLELAVEHSQTEHAHRAINIALVGHCGYFARLSGHNLANCEVLELDWGRVLQRASLKGLLTLPHGHTPSDLGDVRKQSGIIRHWLADLREGTHRSERPTSAGFTAANPPASSNTAHLIPGSK